MPITITGFNPKTTLKGAVLVAMALAGLGVVACSGGPASPPTSQAEELTHSKVVEDTGAELYATNCQACHGDREGKDSTLGAPPHGEAGHTWHHPDAQLRDMVMNGNLALGQMLAFRDKLDESQVEGILAYIKTWWTETQRRGQADVSQRYREALERQNQDQ